MHTTPAGARYIIEWTDEVASAGEFVYPGLKSEAWAGIRRALSRLLAPFVALMLVVGCSSSENPTATPTTAAPEATSTSVALSTATSVPTARPATSTPVPAPTSTPVPPTPVPPTATPSTSPAVVLSRGPTTSRTVALTFDAGSDRGFAREILDTLAKEGVAASFGMTGRWAELNPDLVERMARDGHELINHTYDHSSFTGLSTDGKAMPQSQRWSQLDRTELILTALTGETTRPFFRPPYGDYDASVNRDVGARGYAYNVLWTVDSRGWMGLPAQGIVDRCLQMAVPGAIYVFHVGAASADAQALPGIIAGLRAQGYTFARISEYVPQ